MSADRFCLLDLARMRRTHCRQKYRPIVNTRFLPAEPGKSRENTQIKRQVPFHVLSNTNKRFRTSLTLLCACGYTGVRTTHL